MVYTGDCYVIKMNDNEIHLNNFTTIAILFKVDTVLTIILLITAFNTFSVYDKN